MPKGDASVWHNSVYSITWAKVEFVVWRDGCSIVSACERLARQGMTFTLTKGRNPDQPAYSVEWQDGVKVEHFPRGEEWEYEAAQGKGEYCNGQNLRKLYYTAKKKMIDNERLSRDAHFYLEVLQDDHNGDFMAGIIDSTQVAPRHK